MHYNRKNSPTPLWAALIDGARLFFTILIEGHSIIIYPNLHLNLSISFWGYDFQRTHMHYNTKNSPTPINWRSKFIYAILVEGH